MISKKDLVVGAYYLNACPAPRYARWNGSRFVFLTIDSLGKSYLQSLSYPLDTDERRSFMVDEKIEEIPLNE